MTSTALETAFPALRDVLRRVELTALPTPLEPADALASELGLDALQIKRDDKGIPLPLPLQPITQMRIDGFLPVIINVAPVKNMSVLLGKS